MKLIALQLVFQLIVTFCCKNVHSSETKRLFELRNVAQPPLSIPKCSNNSTYLNISADPPIVSDPVKRFETKHIFDDGNGKGSFAALTENSVFARQVLVEMHRKLPEGELLPTIRNFHGWFEYAEYRSWTFLIDTNASKFANDVKTQYENWKVSQLENGYNWTLWGASIITNSTYHCTDISFVTVKENNEVVEVEVWAEKRETQVKLSTDEEGNAVYFHYGINYTEIPERKKLTTFTTNELKQNAKLIEAFWKELGVTAKSTNYYTVLNEQGALYLGLKQANDEELNRKVIEPSSSIRKGMGNVCYLFEGWNGERIDPTKFIKEYKMANHTGQQQLANLVKDNRRNVPLGDGYSEDREKMDKLIRLEDVKSHATSVDTVTDILTGKKVSQPLDFADSIKVLQKQLSTANSKVKLSGSKLSHNIHRIAKGVLHGNKSGSSCLGSHFLVKSIFNGITNNGATSQAIVGTRVSYGEALMGGNFSEKVGKLRHTVKAGSATKYLGQDAGPIGTDLDVGLNVWSFTKSIERLNNATNNYDKNDAIVDIFSGSMVDAATPLPVTFSPGAPFILADRAGIDVLNKWASYMFRDAKYVAKIKEYLFVEYYDNRFTNKIDWFQTTQKNITHFFMEEKPTRNISVQHNLNFLQNNPSFLGVVFPSRNMQYDGGCYLTIQHCALKNAWGCTRWQGKYVAGKGCDWNGLCSLSSQICVNQRVNRGIWGYDEYKCICSNKPATIAFGSPQKNSYVDFRKFQKLFWEKAVPKDFEGAGFKCKPGSTTNDYKLHELNSRNEYLCNNAIGLLQPSQKTNGNQSTMLFDLADGYDRVYLNGNDTAPSFFRVGDQGWKYFYGGGGRNEFLFDGNCNNSFLRGVLSGGRSDRDAVTILSSCAKGSSINFENGRLSTTNKKLFMSLFNIEEFFGRENEQDLVTVDCQLKSVALEGGRNMLRRDVVKISNTHCTANVTVFVGNYTKVVSTATRGYVSIVAARSWKGVTTNLDIYPEKDLKQNFLFSSTASNQVAVEHIRLEPEKSLSVLVRELNTDNGMALNLNFKQGGYRYQPIFFKEHDKSLYSTLILTPYNRSEFYHTLPKTTSKNPTRIGNQGLQNIFEITGRNWSATGGENDDYFIINTTFISLVDGRGGQDTLMLDPHLGSMTIDLADNKTFKSIENVHGAPLNPEKIICACGTKFLNPRGGSLTKQDVVIVPYGYCKKRELTILAKGNLAVKIEGNVNASQGNSITLVASASYRNDPAATPLQFEFESMSASVSGLNLDIQLHDQNWTALAGNLSHPETSVEILIEGAGNQHVHLKLKDFANSTEPFLASPYIQISILNSVHPSGQLVYERKTSTPKVLYHLSNKTMPSYAVNKVKGIQGISNLFLIHNDSWQVTGGNLDDVIILHNSAQRGRSILDGGNGENNILILESGQHPNNTETYLVDLEIGYFGFNHLTKGIIKRIHHVLGRNGQADIIHANCSTKTINGRDGTGRGSQDLVIISGKNCQEGNNQNLEVQVGKFTKVRNTASHGNFIYHLSDPFTSELNITATSNNFHLVDFGFHPWEHIKNISFDPKESILGIKFGDGNTEKTHSLKMYRNWNSKEFKNPVIQFHQPRSKVTSDVKIAKDEVITATYMINEDGLQVNETVNGLYVPINHFIVNITKKNINAGGRLFGSSSSKANQFWINQLQTRLDILDGGNCDNNNHNCVNYLQFGDSFMPSDNLKISLDDKRGNVKLNDKEIISRLKNIHELRGRGGQHDYDKVTVSSCKIRQLSEMEDVFIIPSKDCSFNVNIYIREWTGVEFEDSSNFFGETPTAWMNSSFHYRFNSPHNFSICQYCEHNGFGQGATHNFYLPFSAGSVDRLWFDSGNEELHYTIRGEDYHHEMIGGVRFGEQFYSQPVMITQDGFKIKVARDGSILLASNAGYGFPKEVIPTFAPIAKKLRVSIMMQTESFFYIGHGNGEGDRNVLQNLGYAESHLVGGGAKDSIYEIVDLQKDVFIYTGFDNGEQLKAEDQNQKQTLDLTDIVAPIRMESDAKYVPKLERSGNTLVISMSGYEHKYPGKIWIINGQQKQVASRIQILLSNAIMDLTPNFTQIQPNQTMATEQNQTKSEHEIKWEIRPKPILVPEGSIYSISKEDFEDGLVIRLENAIESNSAFQLARNGLDLYLTNIRGDNDKKVTTVMITDFLEGNGTQQATTTGFEVTVTLPGFNLHLKDSKLTKTKEAGSTVEVIEISHIPEWKHLLHEAEENLLKNISDITRTFPCDDCNGTYVNGGEMQNNIYIYKYIYK